MSSGRKVQDRSSREKLSEFVAPVHPVMRIVNNEPLICGVYPLVCCFSLSHQHSHVVSCALVDDIGNVVFTVVKDDHRETK